MQENSYVQTWWLTGKEGYNFTLELDVCVFVPKKVKLDRVVVKRDKKGSAASLRKIVTEKKLKDAKAAAEEKQEAPVANGGVAANTAGEAASTDA